MEAEHATRLDAYGFPPLHCLTKSAESLVWMVYGEEDEKGIFRDIQQLRFVYRLIQKWTRRGWQGLANAIIDHSMTIDDVDALHPNCPFLCGEIVKSHLRGDVHPISRSPPVVQGKVVYVVSSFSFSYSFSLRLA